MPRSALALVLLLAAAAQAADDGAGRVRVNVEAEAELRPAALICVFAVQGRAEDAGAAPTVVRELRELAAARLAARFEFRAEDLVPYPPVLRAQAPKNEPYWITTNRLRRKAEAPPDDAPAPVAYLVWQGFRVALPLKSPGREEAVLEAAGLRASFAPAAQELQRLIDARAGAPAEAAGEPDAGEENMDENEDEAGAASAGNGYCRFLYFAEPDEPAYKKALDAGLESARREARAIAKALGEPEPRLESWDATAATGLEDPRAADYGDRPGYYAQRLPLRLRIPIQATFVRVK
ncbi:MAG: hypothetical protein M5U26_03940 [Planctomycetota bacterium]|nr:hypothetical protein [Planctomycetota bacterium]